MGPVLFVLITLCVVVIVALSLLLFVLIGAMTVLAGLIRFLMPRRRRHHRRRWPQQ